MFNRKLKPNEVNYKSSNRNLKISDVTFSYSLSLLQIFGTFRGQEKLQSFDMGIFGDVNVSNINMTVYCDKINLEKLDLILNELELIEPEFKTIKAELRAIIQEKTLQSNKDAEKKKEEMASTMTTVNREKTKAQEKDCQKNGVRNTSWVKEGDFQYFDERRSPIAACTYTDTAASCIREISFRAYTNQACDIYTYNISTSFSSEDQALSFKKRLELAYSPANVRSDYLSNKTVILTVTREHRSEYYPVFPKYLRAIFEDSHVREIAAELCADLNVRLSEMEMQLPPKNLNDKVDSSCATLPTMAPTQPVQKKSNPAQLEEKTRAPSKKMLSPEQVAALLKFCSLVASKPNFRADVGTEDPASRPADAPVFKQN